MSISTLRDRVTSLVAGSSPTSPPADPVVLTSQLAAKLATVASTLPATQPSTPSTLWRNGDFIAVTPAS